MLQLVDDRKIVFHSGAKRPMKIHMHEKEREFFDALRLIIQNGYELCESDIADILRFVQIHELYYFELNDQKTVTKFLKDSTELFGFNPSIIDSTLAEIQANLDEQTSMVLNS